MAYHPTPHYPVLRIALATLVIGVGLAAALVPLLRQSHNNLSDRVQVVAAENTWGDIARQIGGQYVQVHSIITDPDTDPHTYESDANTAKQVAQANVVIANGLGYDDFMARLASTGDKNRPTVTVSRVLQQPDGANPHLWYDLPNLPKVSAAIAAALAQADPAHRSDYQANAARFNQQIQPLLGKVAAIRQQYAGQPVAYTEPVADYLVAAAGLKVASPEGFSKAIEDDSDPSPADQAAMEALFTDKTTRVLLYNAQTVSPVTAKISDLARQNVIPVVGVAETIPPRYPNYQSWMAAQLDALQAALSKSAQ